MKYVSIALAGLAYFSLGGLWFTPLFGRHWDASVGFTRPPRWRPGAEYYVGPLVGCLVISAALRWLYIFAGISGAAECVTAGLVVGGGIGAMITMINAIAPNMVNPWKYAVVVGSYHATGITVSSLVLSRFI